MEWPAALLAQRRAGAAALWRRPVLLRWRRCWSTRSGASPAWPTAGARRCRYRVGEVYPHDLRARVDFEVVNQPQTDRSRDEAVEQPAAGRRDDPAACEAARQAVPPVVEQLPAGHAARAARPADHRARS